MIFLPRLTPLQLRSLMIAVIILVSFTLTMDSAGQTPAGSPTTNEQQQAAKKSGEQQADDVIRISTNLVQVDVIVTDGKGQHVTNLKPEDFVLEIDGKPQSISYFRAITTPPSGPIKSVPTEIDNFITKHKQISPQDVKRSIAIVVDDTNLSFESLVRIRESLLIFINEQMQEGDLIGIIRTGRGVNDLSRFTNDRRQLLLAIKKLSWIPSLDEPFLDLSTNGAGASPAGSDNNAGGAGGMDSYRPRGRNEMLKYVARSLRELPGRKVAVFLSDGLQILAPNQDNTVALEEIRKVIDEAHRGGVAFYTVDTKGLEVDLPNTGPIKMSPKPMGQAPSNNYYRQASQRRFELREGLIYLARETGGLATLNNNDILLGIERSLRDNASYYMLGFEPDEQLFNQRFRSLNVTLRRGGLTVRTRSGFIGKANAPASDVAKPRNQEILDAFFSPFTAKDISVEMTAIFYATPDRKPVVRTMLHFDSASLNYQRIDGDKRTATLELIGLTFDQNGNPLDQQERNFTLTLDETAFQRIKTEGVVYQSDFPITKPGTYQFRAVLRESSSGKLGSASQMVEIPDLSKARLALSGLILAGTSGTVHDSPTRRQFALNSELIYGALAYNPLRDPLTGQAQLFSQIEIYHDGKVIHQSTPRAVEASGTPTTTDSEIGGRLQLKGLEAGDYYLRLLVTDSLGSGKFARAEQWMDFSIRK